MPTEIPGGVYHAPLPVANDFHVPSGTGLWPASDLSSVKRPLPGQPPGKTQVDRSQIGVSVNTTGSKAQSGSSGGGNCYVSSSLPRQSVDEFKSLFGSTAGQIKTRGRSPMGVEPPPLSLNVVPGSYAIEPTAPFQPEANHPGVFIDASGQRFVTVGSKHYAIRYEKDDGAWRIYDSRNPSRPSYPVRFSAQRNWELRVDIGLKGGAPKIDPAKEKNIVERLKEGNLSFAEIARRQGVDERTVGKIAAKLGITSSYANAAPGITPDQRRQIADVLRAGQMSQKKIAAQFSVCRWTVAKIAKDHNLASAHTNAAQRATPEQKQRIIDLLRERRLPHGAIARQVGVTRWTVFNIARQQRIPPAFANKGPRVASPQRRQIAELLSENKLSRKKIAGVVGVGPSTVDRVAWTQPTHTPKPRATPEKVRQIERLFVEASLKPGEIAKRVKLSSVTVCKTLATAGLRLKGKAANSLDETKHIFDLRDQGKTHAQIAAKLKISEKRVSTILRHVNPESGKRSWWNASAQERTNVIRRLDAGEAGRKIAKELSLPLETVRGIANQHVQARNELVSDLIQRGKSPQDVAKLLGMKERVVKRLVHQSPADTHDRRPATAGQKARAVELFTRGESYMQVADELGLSHWEAHMLSSAFRRRVVESIPLDKRKAAIALSREFGDATIDIARHLELEEYAVTVLLQEHGADTLVHYPSQQASHVPSTSKAGASYEPAPELTLEQQETAWRLLGTGLSIEDAAREMNVHGESVARLFDPF